jgi:Cu2+-exporting ATPase
LLTTRGHALETLARATHVVFDKTGTLTYGQLRLLAVKPLRNVAKQHCLDIAAALERGSEHPLGRTLADAASDVPVAQALRNTPGMGVEGNIQGVRYRLGKPDFAVSLSTSTVPQRETGAPEATNIALGDEQGLLAWFQLADSLRSDAAQTVAALRALGLEVLLLSGDQPATVQEIARQAGISAAEGALLPEDKLARIQALQRQGAVVAMVGDGVNDAPVLAAAQVSLAMGGGTAVAHAAADMLLLADRLAILAQGVTVARQTLAVIRQNIGWAITYNLVALPLAAIGLLAPWMAALGMSLSSLLVVANALRLRSAANPRRDSRAPAKSVA